MYFGKKVKPWKMQKKLLQFKRWKSYVGHWRRQGKNQNMPVALANSQSDLSSFCSPGPYYRRWQNMFNVNPIANSETQSPY